MSLERAVLIARRRVRSRLVPDGWAEEVRTLLEAPSPVVLTTHRADHVTAAREAIAGRYLGVEVGKRFASKRRAKPGVLLRLTAREPRVWNLSAILPD
jgi:hypothetical protein